MEPRKIFVPYWDGGFHISFFPLPAPDFRNLNHLARDSVDTVKSFDNVKNLRLASDYAIKSFRESRDGIHQLMREVANSEEARTVLGYIAWRPSTKVEPILTKEMIARLREEIRPVVEKELDDEIQKWTGKIQEQREKLQEQREKMQDMAELILDKREEICDLKEKICDRGDKIWEQGQELLEQSKKIREQNEKLSYKPNALH